MGVGMVRLPSLFNFSSSPQLPLPYLRLPLSPQHRQLHLPRMTTSSLPYPKWVPLEPTKFPPFSSSSFSSSSSLETTSSSIYGSDYTNILQVIWPSLAYANTLHFNSGYYNVKIKIGEEEPEERLVLRFRRAVLKAGILQECKRRRFFESSQDKKKRKARDAAKRNRKRRPKLVVKTRQDVPKKKLDDDEDDNWEIPEGDLPYC